jgi:enoyl-CoA hydratase
MYQTLLFEIDGPAAIITINRPDKMNALNRQVLAEIDEAVKAALENTAVAGIILTGSGSKAFAAGADIAEFSGFSPEEGTNLAAVGHGIFNRIANAAKPVIAAVNGFSLGGGCELAMACHFRVASDNARFGQPEVNLGLVPGYGGTQRLVELVGKGRAIELLITADMVKADEAYRIGLVNHVVSQEDLLPKCKDIISKIAGKGPQAVGECIRLAQLATSLEDGYAEEIKTFGAIFQTPEFIEGTQAFLQKRNPQFER